ncbi:Syntaxin-like protein psy1 [Smittium culicis]|nr:Syntaxin-like protein psy1 [Smittium culicis]
METLNNNSSCDVGDEAVRRGRHAALARKFTEAIVHYRAIEREFQMKFRLRIEKQIRIDKQNGDYCQDLFKIDNKKKAKKVLREVSERNQDIKKIEKTIRELNDLFTEMQILVFKQQTLVDNIEKAVDCTQQYTIKSANELEYALENRENLGRVPTLFTCFFF